MNNINNKSPRLPLNTCSDLLAKLNWEHQQLQASWDTYRTFNFVITANHLYKDWIDKTGTDLQRLKKKNLPPLAIKLFKSWRDISNATKHWKLDRNGGQVVTDVSEPIIGDWYAYFVAGPVIYVEVAGARPSLPELARVTLRCFEWLLSEVEDPFPDQLRVELEMIFTPHKTLPLDAPSPPS